MRLRRLAVQGGAALLAVAAVATLGYWAMRAHPAGAPADAGLGRVERLHPQGDLYVVPVPTEPTDLNPFTTTDGVSRRFVLSYTHDSLLHVDPHTGKLRSSLVARVEKEGGRTFVLHLRDGVRFANGELLTVEDVLFTWELARAEHALPGSMWTDLRSIESLEPIGEGRLRLVLDQEYFAGLGLVTTSYAVVQRRYFIEEVRRRALAAGEPMPAVGDEAFHRFLLDIDLPGPGTGPYRLARDAATGELLWRRGVDLRLTRNDHAWHRRDHRDEFNIDGLKLVFTDDPLERRAMLRRQELDWVAEDDARELLAAEPGLAEHYDAHDYGYLTMGPVFVVWNHENEALADPRVRRALTMLFDRDGLIRLRGDHRARPAPSWFLPGSAREGDLELLPHDIDAARALLAEAGYGAEARTLALRVLTVGWSEYEQIVDFAIPAFARAGIELRKEVVELSVLAERIGSRDFDGFVYAWNPDVFNDPTEIFHSELAAHNWMKYACEEVDRALEAARTELDEERRNQLFVEFGRLLHRDQPMTLLYHRRISCLLHNRFRNVEVGALGLNPRRWWVEPADQLHR